VIGLVELWPHDHTIRARGFASPKTIAAKVLRADRVPCQGGATCRRVSVELLEGPAKGKTSRFTIIGSVGSLAIGRGDHIRVYENKLPAGAVSAAGHKVDRYSFSDFDRRSPMLWLAIAFASLLLFTGRLHGLRALIGLGLSLALVIEFVIPAILAHLSGVSSDESIYLGATQSGLSLRGLLVAGMVIGALGALVDLTVSQASTVVALRRANPKLGFTGLFSGATEVGHDHIAAT